MADSVALRRPDTRSPATTLRTVTVVFTIALLAHAADHVRRGMGASSTLVMALGTVQLVLAVATIALIITRHRWAPTAAMVIGFASAAGFTLVHLLPAWFGPLSDSFINAPPTAHVNGYSWCTAVFEIAADIALGVAAVRARHSWP
jgi:hypothetical protein